jgi:hypothetical protein
VAAIASPLNALAGVSMGSTSLADRRSISRATGGSRPRRAECAGRVPEASAAP